MKERIVRWNKRLAGQKQIEVFVFQRIIERPRKSSRARAGSYAGFFTPGLTASGVTDALSYLPFQSRVRVPRPETARGSLTTAAWRRAQ